MQSNYFSQKTFLEWVELQRNRRYTDLIYLQQHIDIQDMPDTTAEEIQAKQMEAAILQKRINDPCFDDIKLKKSYTPVGIKFLANEMLSVGEKFMIQTIEGQCITHQADGKIMFDLESLLILMRMLGFLSSQGDRAEMKAWFMNKGCVVKGPSYSANAVYIDKEKMVEQIKLLKRDTWPEDPRRVQEKPSDQSAYFEYESWMARQILSRPIQEAISAVEYYQRQIKTPEDRMRSRFYDDDKYISEYDLRKILKQYMERNHNDTMDIVDVFIHQLPTFIPPNESLNFFRCFKISEVK